MMNPEPQAEHRWLDQLLGEWTFVSDCSMGPDQPPMTAIGSESVRSFGGLWTIADGDGESSGGRWKSIMTLGFDPKRGRFVGTFIATMMTHLWIYEGGLNDAKTVLTLDAEGPNCTDGQLIRYQDVIEIVNENERILSSHMQGPYGQLVPFMTARYTRKGTPPAA